MSEDRGSKITNTVALRMEKAAQITELQANKAQAILTEMGVGGQHPDRASILASVMQTMAINYLATVTTASIG